MDKKNVIIVILLAVAALAAGMFFSMRRSHMRGDNAGATAGGLVAVSTDGKPMPIPATAGKLPENTAVQESNGLVVALALNPYPPSGTQASDFDVTLTDTNGKALSDASVSFNLTMPSMWMPPNQFSAEAVSNGKYHGSGRFTMRGWWRIEVIITHGGEKQSVFFDVWL